jgi:hypothetical protein
MKITHDSAGAQARIPVAGGTASAVIDLSGPEYGGRDQRAKQVMIPLAVRGRLRVGHTRALADPDAPIWIQEDATVRPGQAVADLRCPGCVTRCDIGELDGTLAVLEHEDGCRWLAGMLRAAGVTS